MLKGWCLNIYQFVIVSKMLNEIVTLYSWYMTDNLIFVELFNSTLLFVFMDQYLTLWRGNNWIHHQALYIIDLSGFKNFLREFLLLYFTNNASRLLSLTPLIFLTEFQKYAESLFCDLQLFIHFFYSSQINSY